MSHVLYFAYGSNMDTGQMAQRCPGAESIGVATLPGYRFIINRRGYATLLSTADTELNLATETPGVLWRINPDDESALDRYEGYHHGLYDKCFRTVRDACGNKVEALLYINQESYTLRSPQGGYLEKVIEAVETHGLAERHQAWLRAWPRKGAFKAFNRLVNQVKAGEEVSRNIRLHRHTLSSWLKERRDSLILEALDEVCDRSKEMPFEEVLLWTALQKSEEHADQLQLEAAGEFSLEHASLTRFIQHLETLEHEGRYLSVLNESGDEEELAGLGIIITKDPDRPHAPEDRFIVTKHAPALAALWRQVFDGEHDLHPRTCRFLDAFADVAEITREDTEQLLVTHALKQVHTLAIAKRNELRLVLERFVNQEDPTL